MNKHTFVFLTVFFLVFITARPGITGPNPDRILAIGLDRYRNFLKHNPPLDRLYVKEKIGYFLASAGQAEAVSASGIEVIEERFLDSRELDRPFISSNGEYHSYRETRNMLEELASRFPDRAQIIILGQTYEGRDLQMIKISDNVSADESAAEPNIYINGCHHAREWISVEVPLLFARHLLENFETDDRVRRIVNRSQIFIMPIVNPDGLEFSIHTYRLWRKNRVYNGGFSWGVDLNRNYGYMWGFDDYGSSPVPRDGTYRGLQEFSEAETRALRSFMQSFPPAGAIAYHNYSQIILLPWGYTREAPEDIEELTAVAAGMSDVMLPVNGRRYEYGGNDLLYSTNGSFVDWVYGTFRAPAYTIELPPVDAPHGAFFTPESMISEAFSENLPALLYFAEYLIEKHVVASPVEKESQPSPCNY